MSKISEQNYNPLLVTQYVALRVRINRLILCRSIGEMAELFGISESCYKRYETSTTIYRASMIQKFLKMESDVIATAAKLNIPYDKLVHDIELYIKSEALGGRRVFNLKKFYKTVNS